MNELDKKEEIVAIQNNPLDELSAEKKADYYIKIMKEISSRKIRNPIRYIVNGTEYTFDKKYNKEFLMAMRCYTNTIPPRNYITVEKLRKPTILDKFKKRLKRFVVPIMLTAAGYAAMITYGNKAVNDYKNKFVIGMDDTAVDLESVVEDSMKENDAQAKTEEDYALEKNPTRTFLIDNNFVSNNELDQEVLDFLNHNQGRRI